MGIRVKVTLPMQRLSVFFPTLETCETLNLRDDLGYLVEEISKWQSEQEKPEHDSLKNLQSDNMILKKTLFSADKLKPDEQIYISNKEPNVNHQGHGKNISRLCQRPSQKLHVKNNFLDFTKIIY